MDYSSKILLLLTRVRNMLNSTRFFRTLTLYVLVSLLLSACSDGGTPPLAATSPPVATGPTWTKNVFEADSNFKNRCEAPRTGTNPATGSAYPDVVGSTLYENHWLRSWSNDTYLWYNEIDDVNPAGYTDELAYFDVLKTNATTSSGSDKDNFHFTRDTAVYQEQVSTGSSSGYGMRLALISSSPPREIRVALVEQNSPATSATANLMRGAEILEVDGVDAVNGGTQADVDTLNSALFPSNNGETHTFVVRDVGTSTTRSFSMTSESVISAAVQTTQTINTPTGNVGYVLFNTFGIEDAETQIINAMAQLQNANVQDLVLDLGYNGGGFLDIAGQLGYMVAGAIQSSGKTFDRLTFNDKYPTVNPVTGNTLSPTPFHSTSLGFSAPSGQALPSLNLNRVFILSSARTCSASEAVINGLRGIDVDVVLIGTRTCGKPYGFYATDNCGNTYFTIQFSGQNDKGFGEYSDGFTPMNAAISLGELVPGCEVADDFSNQLGDSNEAMLLSALSYRETGSCPAVTTTAFSKISQADNMSVFDMLNDKTEGSLYNSKHMQEHILKEMSLNQRSFPSKVELMNEK